MHSGIVIPTKDSKAYKTWLLEQKSTESERQVLVEFLSFSSSNSMFNISVLYPLWSVFPHLPISSSLFLSRHRVNYILTLPYR